MNYVGIHENTYPLLLLPERERENNHIVKFRIYTPTPTLYIHQCIIFPKEE